METNERLLRILFEIRPEASFVDSSDFIEDGLIDSFDIILLASSIEKEFNIKISGEQINRANFKNIDTLKALVCHI
ncbi:MAG: phosphopantetheine-binding protein [Chitinophagaceae bacterium]